MRLMKAPCTEGCGAPDTADSIEVPRLQASLRGPVVVGVLVFEAAATLVEVQP